MVWRSGSETAKDAFIRSAAFRRDGWTDRPVGGKSYINRCVAFMNECRRACVLDCCKMASSIFFRKEHSGRLCVWVGADACIMN